MNKTEIMMTTSLILLATWALPAQSAVIYTDRTTFESDAGTLATEDFSGYGGSGCNAFQNIPAIDCGPGPFTLDFGSFAVEETALTGISPSSLQLPPDLHLRVTGAGVLQIGGHPAPYSDFEATATWTFDESLYAFAVDTTNSSAIMNIKLLDAGTEIFSFDTINPNQTPYFFGMISNQAFDQVVIKQGAGNTVFYDNVAYQTAPSMQGQGPGTTAVPTPATAWLFSAGLLGLIGATRRKKAA